MKKPFWLENQIRVDETPLHDAVREALVNCLVNADFYQSWSVVIEKYTDKIVMANPGTIITGKEQMLKGGISQPRNKALFKMFNLIGLGEHAGSGVPDIFKAWRDAELDMPVVDEMFGGGKPDRTVLTLPLTSDIQAINQSEGPSLSHSKSTMTIEEVSRVLEFCNIPRSREELQAFCGYKSASYLRKKVLHPLLEGEQLVLTIPEKPNHPNQKYVRRTAIQG